MQFRLSNTSEWHDYTDYVNVFPVMENPRINEEKLLREYIFVTYNEEIAKNISRSLVPTKYFRDLSSIGEQLKRVWWNLVTSHVRSFLLAW